MVCFFLTLDITANYNATKAFIENASSKDKTLLTFEQANVRHALHLDLGVRNVFFKTVQEWITARAV